MQTLCRLLIICFAVGLTACSEPPQYPLRIGTNLWSGYEPLYLARDLGYFSEHDVRLVEYSSASQVIRAYRNGVIDAAALTLDEVLLLAQDGFDPRVILVMDISHGGDVILGRPDIESMAALRNKKIGYENTALGAFVLARALEISGMNVNDVISVPVEAHEHEQAFLRGDVDAVVTFEPVRGRLLSEGAMLLFDSSQIPGEVVDVLVVRADVARKEKARIQDLLGSWFQALRYLKEDPQDAARRMAPRLGLSPEGVLQSYEGIRLPDLEENRRLLYGREGGGDLSTPALRLLNVMREQGLLRKSVDVNQLFAEPML